MRKTLFILFAVQYTLILRFLSLYLTLGMILLFVACQHNNNDEKEEPSIPQNPIFTIEPETLVLAVGESYQLVPKLNGVPLADDMVVRWESNSNMVSVDNGKVTAVFYNEIITGLFVSAEVQGGFYATCKISIYQEYDYKFRLTLKDKGQTDFSLDQPEQFLSVKAIERRNKRGIAIDERDLPISKAYLEQIEKVGGIIVSQSKWLKTVCVQCEDEKMIDEYKKLPFVEDVLMVWRGEKAKQKEDSFLVTSFENRNVSNYSSEDYGDAWGNIYLHQGQILHECGFKGEGIDIAVIDAGFIDLPSNPTLDNIRIKGSKSFVYEDPNPYNTDSHGIWVLACMATNKPGYYIGVAPEANYWLFRSEDLSGNYPVEEDSWVAAIEYADSVGVDIVNTSLYYIKNDYPFSSHEFQEMDGKTVLPTRAANVAADKGILIVCCAGNDGSWVGSPADSPGVLAVGAVNKVGSIGSFTAYGITVDGRMKPDVVSLGQGACTIDVDGKIDFRSGTSYASPIMCGLAACLWQAYPWLTNRELLNILKKSADRYNAPELPYGYGIVDVQNAMKLVDELAKDNIFHKRYNY